VPAAAGAVPGVKASDVTVTGLPVVVFTVPTWVPPVAQFGGEPEGPQTKNVTLPVIEPVEPDRVALSVTDPPGEMLVGLAWVVMVGGAATAPAASDRS
jgi:hypothetical protein